MLGPLRVSVADFAVTPDYVKSVYVCDGRGVKLYGVSLEEIEVQNNAGDVRLVNANADTANLTDEAGDIQTTKGTSRG